MVTVKFGIRTLENSKKHRETFLTIILNFNETFLPLCPHGLKVPVITSLRRHDDLRDLIAETMDEVYSNTKFEPKLQPLSGESLKCNTSDEARLDIAARGFWQRGEIAFFDVRVFNPYAKSLRNQQIQSIFNAQEREKKRTYNQRVIPVEHGSFSPLVFSCYGGHGQETLVTKISEKRGVPRSEIAKYVRTKISFCLVRSSTTCLRGTRRSLKQHMNFKDVELPSPFNVNGE